MGSNLIQFEMTEKTSWGEDLEPLIREGHLPRSCPNSTCVLIGRNGRGQWVARESHGLYGGLFVNRDNAIRYALFENGHRPEAIIMVPGIFELDISPIPEDAVGIPALQGRAA